MHCKAVTSTIFWGLEITYVISNPEKMVEVLTLSRQLRFCSPCLHGRTHVSICQIQHDRNMLSWHRETQLASSFLDKVPTVWRVMHLNLITQLNDWAISLWNYIFCVFRLKSTINVFYETAFEQWWMLITWCISAMASAMIILANTLLCQLCPIVQGVIQKGWGIILTHKNTILLNVFLSSTVCGLVSP